MKTKDTELIMKEIEIFKELLKEVESGHSFSVINYELISDEEAEIRKEFSREINSFYPISEYKEGCFNILTKKEALFEIKKWLKEAFDFNVRFSSKETEAKRIEQEVNNQIEKIANLIEGSILKSIEIEIRTVDKGGNDLVRIDFKQNGKYEVIEFYYFID